MPTDVRRFIAKVWGKNEPFTTEKPVHGEEEEK